MFGKLGLHVFTFSKFGNLRQIKKKSGSLSSSIVSDVFIDAALARQNVSHHGEESNDVI